MKILKNNSRKNRIINRLRSKIKTIKSEIDTIEKRLSKNAKTYKDLYNYEIDENKRLRRHAESIGDIIENLKEENNNY